MVELLVVIAIISILAGMLLPALGQARRQAISIQCVGHQKQVALGIQFYAGDNQDIVNGSSGATYYRLQSTSRQLLILAGRNSAGNRLNGGVAYVGWDVLFCPALPEYADARDPANGSAFFNIMYGLLYKTPVEQTVHEAMGTYLFSYDSTTGSRTYYAHNLGTWDNHLFDFSRMKRPSSLPLLADASQSGNISYFQWGPNSYPQLPRLRHEDRGVFGFADGHVEKMNASGLSTAPFDFRQVYLASGVRINL